MEATFCLSRHLCNVPTFAPPHRNRPTIFFAHVNDLTSFHRRPSLPSRPLQAAWPVQKEAHRHKTWAVSSLLTPPEGGNGGGNGRERETTTSLLLKATVVLACVLGSSMGLAGMVARRADAANVTLGWPNPQSETDNGSPPQIATIDPETLGALLNPQLPTNTAELEKDKSKFKDILKEDSRMDFRELQKVTRKLKMSNKEDQENTIKELRNKYEQYKNSGKKHAASEVGYILVEMLIYQGKFDKDAIEILKECEKQAPETDARPALYWAAAYTMLGNRKEAEKYWKHFQEKARWFFKPTNEKDSNGGGRYSKLKTKIKNVFKN